MMDGVWLARLRWRRRGAWLWPTFVVLSVVDGFIVHALPLAGTTQTLAGGIVAGLVLNLIAVVLLSRPLGVALRHWRRDMPVGVARNYAGAAVVGLMTAGVLAVGLAHHPTIVAQRRELQDAITRAVAFIGDRAPAQFRANVTHTDTYTIEPGVYRTCVPNRAGTENYCVVVRSRMPFARSVVPAGSEPNAIFAAGAN